MRTPPHPYFVLATAILLPGAGHLLCGLRRRAFATQFFMVLGAIITWHLTGPTTSLAGRLAGGLFVYALSLPEAYRCARLQTAIHERQRHAEPL